jgi:pyruvate dehydrogenase E2 component (dihydrolipoamide acetyltransferase)
MAVAIRIPAPDPTTEQVRVVRWLKQKGELVAKDEPILEVETDKAVVEVESFAEGVLLESLVSIDENIPVSTVVAIVGAEGEDYSGLLEQA